MLLQNFFASPKTKWVRLAIIPKNGVKNRSFANWWHIFWVNLMTLLFPLQHLTWFSHHVPLTHFIVCHKHSKIIIDNIRPGMVTWDAFLTSQPIFRASWKTYSSFSWNNFSKKNVYSYSERAETFSNQKCIS